MSKCDVDLIGLYGCIFQDAARAYPALEKEFSKDYSTLRRAVETRGLRLITIDLVAAAKHFDRCLAVGQYSPPGLPLTKRFRGGTQAPKFLRGLHLLVFDEHGSLKEKPDVQAIFFIRQLLLFGKKASYDSDRAALHREVERLLDHDITLPQPHKSWESENEDVQSNGFAYDCVSIAEARTEAIHEDGALQTSATMDRRQRCQRLLWTLDSVSGVLASLLGSFDFRAFRFRHGPGAVSEGPRTTDKYGTCRESWEPLLESEFPIADCGYHSHFSWAADATIHDDSTCCETARSRLVAVPKTVDTPRLIAAEPASKQWCQQNMLDYFNNRIERTWLSKFIRLDDQTQNQRLCLYGSLRGDLCTIDLKAASDSVSCWFVGNLFRQNKSLLRALRAVRTRHLYQDLHPGRPKENPLRKFSMMGSAVTFPVECLGFLAICLAGICYTRGIRPTQKNLKSIEGLSVYGDDLVIPADSWDAVVDLLEVCHFQVNRSKSFREGNFRESCGVDAFMGQSISPAYWRGPYTADPESVQSLVGLRNHLYSRWLMSTSNAVENHLKGRKIPYVGSRSGATGYQSRLAVVLSDPVRYCNAHHSWKAKVLTFYGHSTRTPYGDESALLQYFTERPSPFTKWANGVQSRVRTSMRMRWIEVQQLLG